MVAGLDRAGIGRRSRARRLVAGLLVGVVVGVGGCATGGDAPAGTPSPTAETPIGTSSPSPTPQDPADPLPTADGVVVPELAELPLEEWRFTADELGSGAILADPTRLRPLMQGEGQSRPRLARVIEGDEVWVVGARSGGAWTDPAELVGLSPEAGDLLWRFGAADAQPIACAERLLDGDLACLAEDEGGATAVLFLDAGTGEELGRFALPARSPVLAVDGSHVIAVQFPQRPSFLEEVEVARYTRTGTLVWSTTFDPGTDIPATDSFWQKIVVSGRLVLLDLNGALRVLDAETGDLVVERGSRQIGRQNAEFLVRDDGRIVLGLLDLETQALRVVVFRADATLAHTLAGMRLLTPAALGGASPVLLQDADGRIHTLDVASGATAATGTHPGSRPARGASLVDGTLVVSQGDGLRGFDISEPGSDAAWTSAWGYYESAFTDGERVYGVVRDEGALLGRATAIAVATGEFAWQLERPVDAVTIAGGRLLAVEGDAITALAPDTSPFGNFEAASAVAGGIEVAGWAIDPDTTDPIHVWVTVDGVGQHLHANVNRPDVADVYPAFGPGHGFQGVVSAGAGTHRVCVTASNVGLGDHELLGCRTVSLASVDVYFQHEDRYVAGTEPYTQAVQRIVPAQAPAMRALQALFAGPTAAEQSQGLRVVLSEATGFAGLSISDGIARVRLTGGCNSQGATFTIANLIALTLKQFPTVSHVKIYDPAGETAEPDGPSDSIPACLEP